MAYESSVVLRCGEEMFAELKELFEKGKALKPSSIRKGIYYYLSWENISWKEKYPEIEEIMKIVKSAFEEKKDFYFIRSGDNFDDVEEWGVSQSYDVDEIYIRKAICIPEENLEVVKL